MRVTVTIMLVMLSTKILFAQHVALRISSDFKVKEATLRNQTVTHSIYYNDNFYTVTNSGGGVGKWLFTKLYDMKYIVTLSRFDRDMKEIGKVELDNGERDFGPLMPSMICFNNGLYLAYFKTADKSSFSLYLARVDEDNLSLDTASALCKIQQENVGITQILSVIEGGIVYFAVSPDNTRLLAVCRIAPGKVQTMILDKDLHILRQATVPVNLESFSISSAVLTNDNGACLVLSSPEGIRILGIGADGHKTESRFGQSGNLAPNNCYARLSRDSKSILLFSSANSGEASELWCGGFIVTRMDAATFKISKPLTYAFDEEFIKAMAESGGGIKHKGEYAMYNFVPQILEMDNGDLVISGSPEITTHRMSQSAPNMDNQTHMIASTTLNVGPVFLLFPDVKGKTFGQVVIPRQIVLEESNSSGSGAIQMVQSPSVSSIPAGFIAKPLGGDIVIIYADNPTNLSESVGEKVRASKKAGDLELAEALVNKDRKLEYRRLVSRTDQGRATFYLGDAVPSNNADIVFPIGKQNEGFTGTKTIFSNWCFLEIK